MSGQEDQDARTVVRKESIMSLDDSETDEEAAAQEGKEADENKDESNETTDESSSEEDDTSTTTKKKKRKRAKVATYLVEGSYECQPANYEDHTFSGIMFDLAAKNDQPFECVEFQSFHVRGDLGPMKIFTCEGSFQGKHSTPGVWSVVHMSRQRPSSHYNFVELSLAPPIRLKPGEVCGVYIHSGMPGDQGLVYSNSRGRVTMEDDHMCLLPGVAHLNPIPFNGMSPWGYGGGWRNNREFCGKITYGVKWQLWRPRNHHRFNSNFRRMVLAMLLVHSGHRDRRGRISSTGSNSSVASRGGTPRTIGIWSLPKDTIYHILHFCSSTWANSLEGQPAGLGFLGRRGWWLSSVVQTMFLGSYRRGLEQEDSHSVATTTTTPTTITTTSNTPTTNTPDTRGTRRSSGPTAIPPLSEQHFVPHSRGRVRWLSSLLCCCGSNVRYDRYAENSDSSEDH